MDRLFSVLADQSDGRVGGGDSFVDRLNCRFTVFILVIFAVLVTTKNFVGDPISCWCPAFFTSSHMDYANKVCWVKNTYYLPYDEEIPEEGKDREYINYYQWVGLILIIQAVMFYIPRPIWLLFSKKTGIAVTTVTDAAIQCQRQTDPDSRDKTLRYMTKHLGRYLRERARKHMLTTSCKGICYKAHGFYLIFVYLIIKLLYIGNVFLQLYMLNAFLGTSYHMYGIDIIRKMVMGQSWSQSNRFPRVTMCDFKIRVLGNVQRFTIQCALPVNLFNEKIYIFIWFWFVFVAFATLGSLLMWAGQSFYLPRQVRFIRSRLVAMDKIPDASKCPQTVKEFVEYYLCRDGVFIIRMVSKNSSDLIAAELVAGLWEHFRDNRGSIIMRNTRTPPETIITGPKEEASFINHENT